MPVVARSRLERRTESWAAGRGAGAVHASPASGVPRNLQKYLQNKWRITHQLGYDGYIDRVRVRRTEMQIKIRETGEIKGLSYMDASGIDGIADLIGNHDGFNGQFAKRDDARIVSSESGDSLNGKWFANHASMMEAVRGLFPDATDGTDFSINASEEEDAEEIAQWMQDEDRYEYSADEGTYDWWLQVSSDLEAVEERICEMEEEGVEGVREAVASIGRTDLEYQAAEINEALDALEPPDEDGDKDENAV
jgi:hypothetical protein